MASFTRTLRVLLRKNFLLRMRARSRTILELVLPLAIVSLYIAIWGIMMSSQATYGVGPATPMPTNLDDGKASPADDVAVSTADVPSGGGDAGSSISATAAVIDARSVRWSVIKRSQDSEHAAVVDDAGDASTAIRTTPSSSTSSSALSMMSLSASSSADVIGFAGPPDGLEVITAAVRALGGDATVRPFDTASDMEREHKSLLCGVVFDEASIAMARFNYTLRFDPEDVPATDNEDPMFGFDVRKPGLYNLYLRSGFLALQRAIDQAVLERVGSARYSPASQFRAYTIRTGAEDRALRTKNFNKGLLPYSLAAVLALSTAAAVFAMMSDVVSETDKGTRGALTMMGASSMGYIASHALTGLLFLLPSMLVLPAVLKASVVPHTGWGVLVGLLIPYALSAFALAFLVIVFAKSPNMGPAIAVFVSIAFLSAGIVLTVVRGAAVIDNHTASFLGFLASPIALAFSAEIIAHRELAVLSTTSMSAGCPDRALDAAASVHCMAPASLGSLAASMMFSALLYTALAAYFGEIFPGKAGVARKWWFPVDPSFWRSMFVRSTSAHPLSVPRGPSVVNGQSPVDGGNPRGRVLLSVQGLTKEFPIDAGSSNGDGKKTRKAVAGVSFEAREGELLGLLGHNGAGKSTLINMLSGLLDPTSGDAWIDGHSITTAMPLARGTIGVCPQQDILWPQLTVREHLALFAELKGTYDSPGGLSMEIESTLGDTAMPEKADFPAGSLSGGQKRRLLAAVAFVGGSRVVFLDEPSSGVDPSSRAAMSEYIDSQRTGRVIVLVSHFLEDVDELADDVVLLSRGKVRAKGSPVALKAEFGLGYALTLITGAEQGTGSSASSKSSSSSQDPAAIAAWVADRVPGAKLVSATSSEIVVRLPSQSSHHPDQDGKSRPRVGSDGRKKKKRSGSQSSSTGGGGGGGGVGLARLFSDLDAGALAPRGVRSYGVTGTTLQDVFLRLTGEESILEGEQGQTNEELGMTFEERVEHWRARAAAERLHGGRSKGAVPGKSYGSVDGSGSSAGGGSPASSPAGSGAIAVDMPRLELIRGGGDGVGAAPNVSFLRQVYALFVKRVIGLRQYGRLGVHLFVIAMIALGVLMGRHVKPLGCTFTPEAKVALDLSYAAPFLFASPGGAASIAALSAALAGNVNNNDNNNNNNNNNNYNATAVGTTATGDDLIRQVLIPNKTGSIGAIDGFTLDPGTGGRGNASVIVYDAENVHALPMVSGAEYAAALRNAAPVTALEPLLVTRSHPFPQSALTTDAVLANLNAIVYMVLFFGVAFALVVASFTTEVLREVDCGVRLQQKVSGVSTTAYWIGHASFDILLCAVVVVPTMLIGFSLARGTREVLLEDGNAAAVFLLCLGFAYAAVPFAYLASLRFERASSALGAVFGALTGINILFLTVIINIIVQYALGSIPLVAARIVSIGFGAMSPCNALLTGLMQLSNIVNIRCHEHAGTSGMMAPLSLEVAGGPLLILVVQGTVFFVILIVADNWESIKHRLGACCGSEGRYGAANDPFAPNDADGHEDPNDPAVIASRSPAVRGEQARVLEGQCDHHPVVIRAVTKEFAAPGGLVKRAVRGITLSVDAGEILVILGPNGAGKTSLFGMVTGTTMPNSGSVSVCGIDVSSDPAAARAQIGVVPQHSALFPRMTVQEHLLLFGRIRGLSASACRAQARAVIDRLDMDAWKHRECGRLSGGMKRRVSLGIALMGSPRVLVVDEVSTGVDPHGRTFLWTALKRLRAEGVAIMLTTHALDEADALADRIVIIVDGRVLCTGTPRTVRADHGAGLELTLHAGSPSYMPQVTSFVDREFQRSNLVKCRTLHASWRIAGSAGAAFSAVEAQREREPGMITDHLIASQSLEQVFLSFAAMQRAKVSGIDLEEGTGGGPEARFDSPFEIHLSRGNIAANVAFALFGMGIVMSILGLVPLILFGISIVFARTHALMTLKVMLISVSPYGRRLDAPRPHSEEKGVNWWVVMANLLWFPAGLYIAAFHILFGCICVILIVTFPFAKQHFRIAPAILIPFGRIPRDPTRSGCVAQCGV